MKQTRSFKHISTDNGAGGVAKYNFDVDHVRAVEAIAFETVPLSSEYQPRSISVDGELRSVICISTQAGCNVGCRFCATGQLRAYRNLTSEEMVEQALTAAGRLHTQRPLSVTFSGMGEPLLNLPAVAAAADRLCTEHGFEYASLSTVVIPQALARLEQTRPATNVFVSLHATEDGLRRSLIPSGMCYPVFEVIRAAGTYARNTGRRVKLSYLLLANINDSDEDARRLGQIADPEIFIVQLLLWNEVPGMPFTRLGDAEAEAFAAAVRSEGATAYVMRSAGRDVAGGCGQFAGRARGA